MLQFIHRFNPTSTLPSLSSSLHSLVKIDKFPLSQHLSPNHRLSRSLPRSRPLSSFSLTMAQHYKHDEITLERIHLFTGWTDFNTIGAYPPARMKHTLCGNVWTHKTTSPITLSSAFAPDRISFQEAMLLPFQPASVGQSFGPSWATYWFRLDITIPASMHNATHIHLMWDSNSEAMVWDVQGHPCQGLTGGPGYMRRLNFPLDKYPRDKSFTLYIEMACNTMFGNAPKSSGTGGGFDIEPPDEEAYFVLETCCLAVFNPETWALLHDLTTIYDIARSLPKGHHRRERALIVANDIVNVCFIDDPSTFTKGRQMAHAFLSVPNAPNSPSIFVVGHCHIDTAWLWPYAETRRKCARSWATQIRNMEKYPEFIFAVSQAQQYEWVKQDYPSLYAEIQTFVKRGQFLPVGGTWIEMDCNVPSGESLVRQFLFGQQFFMEEFGIQCSEFWLPDTFGYAAQLPQIMRQAGITKFMTQKLSWNKFNKMPHTTFRWQGLDGSQVLAHFPPADTYISIGCVQDVVKSISHNKDLGVCPYAMLAYGHGDGGGGPSSATLESLRRQTDVEGIPRVVFSGPDGFFDKAMLVKDSLPKWVGELYFELHRGTYTSQAKTKKGNRLCEIALRKIEILSTFVLALGLDFPYEAQLKEMWKMVLLNQFHDTIPGSSIGLVYKDAERHHQEVLAMCGQIETALKETLFKDRKHSAKKRKVKYSAETSPHKFSVDEQGSLITIAVLDLSGMNFGSDIIDLKDNGRYKFQIPGSQLSSEGNTLVAVKENTDGIGIKFVSEENYPPKVTVNHSEDNLEIENDKISVKFSSSGQIVCFVAKNSKGPRQVIAPDGKGNRLVLYEDFPLNWEAWDVDIFSLEKPVEILQAHSCEIIEAGPLRVVISFSYKIGQESTLKQKVMLTSTSARIDYFTEVDWRENRKVLRVEFDTSILSSTAHYETQFGYVSRNTHFNTSHDVAKFEVCGHRYADLSEHEFGLSLLNDCKYGYSIRDSVMRMTLLRAPKAPDDQCDMGLHEFTYSSYPHHSSFPDFRVVEEACKVNLKRDVLMFDIKTKACDYSFELESAVYLRHPSGTKSVVIDTIKKAEKKENTITIRLYESLGGQKKVYLCFSSLFQVLEVDTSDILEKKGRNLEIQSSQEGSIEFGKIGEGGKPGDPYVTLEFTPFEIKTLLVRIEPN